MQKFVNLHGHTLGSVLDAIISPEELMAQAAKMGFSAIAVTDHGNMSQIWAAYKSSKKHNVRLIPGNEIYFVEDLVDPKAKRRHLVLLASNATGYKNLCRVTYEGFLNSVTVMGRQFPRVDAAILKKYSEGIFATSACGGSIIAAHLYAGDTDGADRHAKIFHDIYGDRFYIELQPHTLSRGTFDQVQLNGMLKSLAERLGIKMVATCDSHYLTAEDEKFHDMVLAISSGKPLSDVSRHRYVSSLPCTVCAGAGGSCADCGGTGIGEIVPCPEFYLKTEDQIRTFFTEQYSAEFAEQLIDNTAYIASQCEAPTYLEPDGERLAKFDMKMIAGCSDAAEFEEWVGQKPARQEIPVDNAFLRFRVAKRYREYTAKFTKKLQKEYWERIELELDILEARGFCSYMLMVADTLEWAMNNDIWIGIARGSAGSSLIAFFLGIHKLDPMPHGLIFERFQNKERKQCPDIDTDILSSGRGRVIAYMRERWGDEYTAQITNVNRITPKVAIKDISKSLEIGSSRSESFALADRITKQIPLKVTKEDGKTIEINTLALARQYSPPLDEFFSSYPEVENYAEKIVGLPRSWGVHAGGVVISDRPLPDFVPLRRDNEGVISVHYDKYATEEIGLIKIDMLGLDTIDVLRETYLSANRCGTKLPKFWEIDETDQAVYRMISAGDVLGLFQLEGGTLAKLCKPVQPKCIEDISLINALGRPGIDKKKRQQFIQRRAGHEPIEYAHPELESIAKSTMGISVYDEDLLKIASHIAGWSLSEADGLRKLTKLKEKGADLAEKLEKKFVSDAEAHGVVNRKDAQMIWDVVIADYAKYGFCLSADQLVATSSGNKKISELTMSDKVAWRDSAGVVRYNEPIDVWCSGEKEVLEVTLEDGTTIRGTADHRFLYDGEWVSLGKLIEIGEMEVGQ
jgi:DNA polymerase-3 subunit alpha